MKIIRSKLQATGIETGQKRYSNGALAAMAR